MPYNHKYNVLHALFNQTFPSFLPGHPLASEPLFSFCIQIGRDQIDPSWGGPIELFLIPSSVPRLV